MLAKKSTKYHILGLLMFQFGFFSYCKIKMIPKINVSKNIKATSCIHSLSISFKRFFILIITRKIAIINIPSAIIGNIPISFCWYIQAIKELASTKKREKITLYNPISSFNLSSLGKLNPFYCNYTIRSKQWLKI